MSSNAETERSNCGVRFQRVRAGESRISEPQRITLTSSKPKDPPIYGENPRFGEIR